MKKKISAIVAVLLVLSMVAVFAACGNKDKDPTTTTTTAPTEAPTGEADPMPTTPEEIVEYYNKVANATKSASKVTVNEVVDGAKIAIGGITQDKNGKEIGNTTMSVINKAVDSFAPKPEENTYNFVNGMDGENDIKEKLPSKGNAAMSLITAADVANATCEQSGNYYVVKMTLKSELVKLTSGPTPETAHAKSMICLEASDLVKDWGAGLELYTADLDYANSTIEATIDPYNGVLVSLDTALLMTGTITGKAPLVGNITGTLDTTTYIVAYTFSNIEK